MTTDDLFRAGAVVAAVAVVAAPYRQQAAAWVAQAFAAAAPYRGLAARVAAAGLLLWAAWGHLPSLPALPRPTPAVTLETPSESVQQAVRSVGEAMANVGPAGRAVWREAWRKSALVVEADRASGETQAFPKTSALRSHATLVLDIAWRRIGGNRPGSVPVLRDATEAAYAAVVGDADVPVTPDVRERYAELARGMIWAAR